MKLGRKKGCQMNKIVICAIALVVFTFATWPCMAAEKVLYNFEKDAEGWEIPEWALEKQDYVGRAVERSGDAAKDGKGSLRLDCGFPGKVWAAGIVEVAESLNLADYGSISCDVYLPKDAPSGLEAMIILTVGESWKWVEMSRGVFLVPGEWTTLTGGLLPGVTSWRRTIVDENFRKDIRKIDIRIESDKKPIYKGPVYIDNIRVGSK